MRHLMAFFVAFLPWPASALAEAVEAAAGAPAITVISVRSSDIVQTADVTGTLVPREEILVSPQFDGVAITRILVEEGDTVTAGQVLARLSSDALNAAMAQNTAQIARYEAAIAEAEAARQSADADFGRTRDLARTGTASRETFDTRQAAMATATARVASAQADLAFAYAQRQELQVKLANTDIKAPVAGVVSRRIARLGSVVSMNADALFRIISDGLIELEADVPEATLARLHPGQRARLAMAGSVTRTGTIRLVSPEMNRLSRLGLIRIAIDPGEGTLVLGGFGRAVIQTARHTGLVVPLSAIQFEPSGPQVEIVHGGVVEGRPVTLGLREAGQVEIAGGIRPGEAVISLSGTFIRPGDHVIAVEAPAGKGS